MKKFQKINDSLFKELPEYKMNSIAGGTNAKTLTEVYSTGSFEGADPADIDSPRMI